MGVNWDKFAKEDLLEIVQVSRFPVPAVICFRCDERGEELNELA